MAQVLEAGGLRYLIGGSPLDEEPTNRRLRVQVTADPDRYLDAYTPEDIPENTADMIGAVFRARDTTRDRDVALPGPGPSIACFKRPL
ncbi:MAG: hypothetical protein AB7Q16_15380 [Vicinamibacterales bacterium]